MFTNPKEDPASVVLVVEDSPTQAMTIQSLLNGIGLKAICATNGKEGLRLAGQVQPQLILLDIQMPDMNGFEVCESLKKDPETTHIPVILFTRYDSPEARQKGLRYGVVDYIPKDVFAFAVLLGTLQRMGFVQKMICSGNDPKGEKSLKETERFRE